MKSQPMRKNPNALAKASVFFCSGAQGRAIGKRGSVEGSLTPPTSSGTLHRTLSLDISISKVQKPCRISEIPKQIIYIKSNHFYVILSQLAA